MCAGSTTTSAVSSVAGTPAAVSTASSAAVSANSTSCSASTACRASHHHVVLLDVLPGRRGSAAVPSAVSSAAVGSILAAGPRRRPARPVAGRGLRGVAGRARRPSVAAGPARTPARPVTAAVSRAARACASLCLLDLDVGPRRPPPAGRGRRAAVTVTLHRTERLPVLVKAASRPPATTAPIRIGHNDRKISLLFVYRQLAEFPSPAGRPERAGLLQVPQVRGLLVMPRIVSACSGSWWMARVVLATLSAPRSFRVPMARLRKLAMARGAFPA